MDHALAFVSQKQFCPVSWKWYDIGTRLLWNVNNKLQVANRSVSVQVTLSNVERRHAFRTVQFPKINVVLSAKHFRTTKS